MVHILQFSRSFSLSCPFFFETSSLTNTEICVEHCLQLRWFVHLEFWVSSCSKRYTFSLFFFSSFAFETFNHRFICYIKLAQIFCEKKTFLSTFWANSKSVSIFAFWTREEKTSKMPICNLNCNANANETALHINPRWKMWEKMN